MEKKYGYVTSACNFLLSWLSILPFLVDDSSEPHSFYLVCYWPNLSERQRLPVSFFQQPIKTPVQLFENQTGMSFVVKPLKELNQALLDWVQNTQYLQNLDLWGKQEE